MDCALRTNELLHEIFSHLHPCFDSTALYYAALTCRRFASPALDALWSLVIDVNPLLSLLPDFRKDDEIYPLKSLCKEDLSKFDRYSRRIKELEYSGVSLEVAKHIQLPLILDLLQCLDRPYLLPNLRRLYVEGPDNINLQYFVFCPTLRFATPDFSAEQAASGLPRLVRLSPHLLHLSMLDHPIPAAQLPLISNFRHLQRLITISDFNLSLETFSTIFTFAETLKSWELGSIIVTPANPTTRLFSGTLPCFPSLTSLEFTAPESVGAIADALAHKLFPSLQQFRVTVGASLVTDEGIEGWPRLFSALFSKGICLEGLTIVSNLPEALPLGLSNDIFTHVEDIGPQTLKTMAIYGPLVRSLPCSSVKILVKSFPHLTQLDVSLPPAGAVKFSDLVLFASGLLSLTRLNIRVDPGSVPAQAQTSTIPILSHGLKRMELKEEPQVRDPFQFARCLDRLFPFVSVSGSPTIDAVGRIIGVIRAGRQDQEARLAHQGLILPDSQGTSMASTGQS